MGSRPKAAPPEKRRYVSERDSVQRNWGRHLRWFAAVVLLVVIILMSTISAGGKKLLVCSEGGGHPCRPVELADPPIVVALALVALLLMPDLSRVSIGGVLELERSVERTQQEVQATRHEVEGLKQQLTAALTARAEAQVTHHQHFQFLAPGEATVVSEDAIKLKAEEVDDV